MKFLYTHTLQKTKKGTKNTLKILEYFIKVEIFVYLLLFSCLTDS